MSDERNCRTCAHRYGWDKCATTGYFCSTETQYGGLCMHKGEPKLWQPRRSLSRRVIRFFVGVKA